MQQAGTRVRIGIDIGGTFTDFVLLDEATGRIRLEKTSTTPGRLTVGVGNGLDALGVDLASARMIVHGTTVGLNCFLERKGARTGLITTAGFRDVYEIGRVNREEMYDLFYRKPEPLVPREHRLEVRERVTALGEVLVPLDEDDVCAAAARFRADGISSIAVCLLHAYANPAHEVRIGEILAAAYPEALVTLSHDLAREWREYERTSTAAINAYIGQVVEGYLGAVEDHLAARGHTRPFFVNQSSGGVISVATAKGKPVRTIMSGPAGGAVSAAALGAQAGFPDVIAFDMGGTSTDVSLAIGGQVRVTAESRLERHPVMVPMVDIRSIGAGGGSVAWLDAHRRLDVGPRSAGAEPGPACYGRGGAEPAVTDANLVLGHLAERPLAAGILPDRDAAERAIRERIAGPLGLSVTEAAAGIIDIVNSKMAYAIRAITVQRGLDPAGFAMLAFGGAGPMHGCAIARELGIPVTVVPVAPGAFSALGMLLGDVRHDLVRTRLARFDAVDPADLAARFAALEAEGAAMIAAEAPEADPAAERSVELRYVGQEYTVRVPVPPGEITQDALLAVRREFDRRHEQHYGHASSGEPAELINLRVTALGRLGAPAFEPIADGGQTPPETARIGEQPAWFAGGFAMTPIWNRDALLAGNRIAGPALVLEGGATTVIDPGFAASVDRIGNLVIRQERAQ
ncbi:MAG: hydantoinase/oxoprolinase family protein [Chloroflexota bacterium]